MAFHYNNKNCNFLDIDINILTCHYEVYAGTEEDPVGWVVEVGEERVGQEVVVHLVKVSDPDFSNILEHLGQVFDPDFSKYRGAPWQSRRAAPRG